VSRVPRRRVALVALVTGLALVATGCSSSSDESDGTSPSHNAGASAPPPGPKVTVVPAANATKISPVTPISVRIDKGKIKAVSVKASDGDAVEGTAGPDGRSWASKGKLAFGSKYTVTVTTDGATKPATSTFSTVPTPGADSSVRTSSILGDGKTYGDGMPIIFKLSRSVKTPAKRAAYEKTLTVTSTPATTGAWGWVSSTELHFRPKAYWAAGSKVHVAIDSAGRSLGDGLWGRTDLTVDFKVSGTARHLIADSAKHTMTVVENGQTVRTMRVSLGKPQFPSSSGTMVIIDKRPKAMFDSSTYGLPVDAPGGYRTEVQYAMRLTWGGEFIHSAPWSVQDQGVRNVSHGCINTAPADAVWLFNRLLVGDPVTVRNTGTPIAIGNGYSDWSDSFDQWTSRSATGARSTA
jgi:lipoprotein-anchoring transpeptidase ErfK/SrfK